MGSGKPRKQRQKGSAKLPLDEWSDVSDEHDQSSTAANHAPSPLRTAAGLNNFHGGNSKRRTIATAVLVAALFILCPLLFGSGTSPQTAPVQLTVDSARPPAPLATSLLASGGGEENVNSDNRNDGKGQQPGVGRLELSDEERRVLLGIEAAPPAPNNAKSENAAPTDRRPLTAREREQQAREAEVKKDKEQQQQQKQDPPSEQPPSSDSREGSNSRPALPQPPLLPAAADAGPSTVGTMAGIARAVLVASRRGGGADSKASQGEGDGESSAGAASPPNPYTAVLPRADRGLWQCPTGAPSDPFRSVLRPLRGEPQHAMCGVVVTNVCLKNSRPIVFVDEATPGAIPRSGGGLWPLDDDEQSFLRSGGGGGGVNGGKGVEGAVGSGSSSTSAEAWASAFQLTPGGVISLCNEAVKGKPRFQMRELLPAAFNALVVPTLRLQRGVWEAKGMLPLLPQAPPPPRSSATKIIEDGGAQQSLAGAGASSGRYEATYGGCDGKVLVAPFCWELYGYHLLLCIMAMHAHLGRLGLLPSSAEEAGVSSATSSSSSSSSGEYSSPLRIIVAVSKASKHFPYMTGSSTDWGGAVRLNYMPSNNNNGGGLMGGALGNNFATVEATSVMPSRTHPSTYWRLWATIADSPSDVFPDSDVPPQCFRLAVLGAPASFAVSNAEGRAFRRSVLLRLAVPVRRLSSNPSGSEARGDGNGGGKGTGDVPALGPIDGAAEEGGSSGGDTSSQHLWQPTLLTAETFGGLLKSRLAPHSRLIGPSEQHTPLLSRPSPAAKPILRRGTEDVGSGGGVVGRTPLDNSLIGGQKGGLGDGEEGERRRLTAVGGLIRCRRYRVVIIQRSTSYAITNIGALTRQVRCVVGGGRWDAATQACAATATDPASVNTEEGESKSAASGHSSNSNSRLFSLHVAVLEKLSLEQQLELAANTDLIIAVHGNGLTWTALMPTGGAVIELWPNYVYNSNYQRFAERNALLKVNVAAGNADCRHRCPMAYTIPDDAFAKVLGHLDRAACHGAA